MGQFNHFIASVFGLSTYFAASVSGAAEVLEIHGSGSTNPAKCVWDIQDQLQNQVRLPTRMTYRAIGSSTGTREFLASASDFAISDIPLSSEAYEAVTSQGRKVLQIPFVFSTVSVVHSFPDNNVEVKLSPCVLARILKGEITTWDDDEISALNPELQVPVPGFKIQVNHRFRGSSTTRVLTRYLNRACPSEWPPELVGAAIEWPSNFVGCEGSSGMSQCVRETPGSIGYLQTSYLDGEAAAGGLKEIYVQNVAGSFVSAQDGGFINRGSVESAIRAALPTNFDGDFSSVDLLNQPGELTFPMVSATYFFLDGDLGFKTNLEEQGLLVATVKAFFNTQYISSPACEGSGFVALPPDLAESAIAAIEQSVNPSNGGVPSFEFEVNTQPIEGQGIYKISFKRQTATDIRFDEVESSNRQLLSTIAALQSQIQDLELQLKEVVETQNNLQTPPVTPSPSKFPTPSPSVETNPSVTATPTITLPVESNITTETATPTTSPSAMPSIIVAVAQESSVPDMQETAGPTLNDASNYYYKPYTILGSTIFPTIFVLWTMLG